ncbi:MAG TPA: methyltransferase domain-containing protein [Phycisphaerae bacterium]|nr:methyltransferase domain-containing protein [Phycisphaerae bacterium]HRR87167.1 methyltransferase domain-containing protein [Phycisphaerae bacterium]
MTVDCYLGYVVRRETWRVGGQTFHLIWPADIDGLLDLPDVQERFSKDQYMPYWAQPWPAGVLLAEAILAGEDGQGRQAVELGCGIGLVSLAAARMGWSITASDYDEHAIAFARLNAANNNICLAAARMIDFRLPPESSAYERVFGADLTYERRNAEPLARWLASALKAGGEAWLSDPNRSAGDEFPSHARALGLKVDVRAVESTSPVGLLHRGRIWRVCRP